MNCDRCGKLCGPDEYGVHINQCTAGSSDIREILTNKENDMKVQAKFVVEERKETVNGYALKLRAVAGQTGEDAKFFKYTPGGTLELMTINEKAAAQFTPGKKFYLDFTEAE